MNNIFRLYFTIGKYRTHMTRAGSLLMVIIIFHLSIPGTGYAGGINLTVDLPSIHEGVDYRTLNRSLDAYTSRDTQAGASYSMEAREWYGGLAGIALAYGIMYLTKPGDSMLEGLIDNEGWLLMPLVISSSVYYAGRSRSSYWKTVGLGYGCFFMGLLITFASIFPLYDTTYGDKIIFTEIFVGIPLLTAWGAIEAYDVNKIRTSSGAPEGAVINTKEQQTRLSVPVPYVRIVNRSPVFCVNLIHARF